MANRDIESRQINPAARLLFPFNDGYMPEVRMYEVFRGPEQRFVSENVQGVCCYLNDNLVPGNLQIMTVFCGLWLPHADEPGLFVRFGRNGYGDHIALAKEGISQNMWYYQAERRWNKQGVSGHGGVLTLPKRRISFPIDDLASVPSDGLSRGELEKAASLAVEFTNVLDGYYRDTPRIPDRYRK